MAKKQLVVSKARKRHSRQQPRYLSWWEKRLMAANEALAWVGARLPLNRRPFARPLTHPAALHTASPAANTTADIPADTAADTTLAFTCSLVTLHAKLAKFKGHLSADAFMEFRCLFPVGDAESHNIRTLFKLAWEDSEPLENHIHRLRSCYPQRSDLYISVMSGLARHMLADGQPTKAQLAWLHATAQHMGINRLQMRPVILKAQLPLEAQPHALFQLPKRADEAQIKAAYRRFMQRCHPDKVMQANLPETRMASERLSRAGTLAYKKLRA